jgi:hypothetical protein
MAQNAKPVCLARSFSILAATLPYQGTRQDNPAKARVILASALIRQGGG